MNKHYFWRNDSSSGRVGVLIEGDRLEIYQACGAALPAGALGALLALALTPENVTQANALHLARANKRYTVWKRIGMSGCADYILRYVTDERRQIVRTGGRIHVSMAAKLNSGIDIYLGDLPPLLARMLPDYPAVEISIEEAEIGDLPGYGQDWQIAIEDGNVVVEFGEDDDTFTPQDEYLSSETLARLRTIQFEGEEEDNAIYND